MSHYHCALTNARIQVRLGIYDFEKLEPQPIVVSVRLSIPFSALPKIKSIRDTVDYEPIRNFIRAWEQRPHVDLIETLLHELVSFCFEDVRVEQVEASIRKSAIFDEVEEVGVGITTNRQDWLELAKSREV
jgi:dihydroneopterin aldolase